MTKIGVTVMYDITLPKYGSQDYNHIRNFLVVIGQISESEVEEFDAHHNQPDADNSIEHVMAQFIATDGGEQFAPSQHDKTLYELYCVSREIESEAIPEDE